MFYSASILDSLFCTLQLPGEIGRKPPALTDAVDELGQLGSGAGQGGSGAFADASDAKL